MRVRDVRTASDFLVITFRDILPARCFTKRIQGSQWKSRELLFIRFLNLFLRTTVSQRNCKNELMNFFVTIALINLIKSLQIIFAHWQIGCPTCILSLKKTLTCLSLSAPFNAETAGDSKHKLGILVKNIVCFSYIYSTCHLIFLYF